MHIASAYIFAVVCDFKTLQIDINPKCSLYIAIYIQHNLYDQIISDITINEV